jgi:hypothetical protein
MSVNSSQQYIALKIIIVSTEQQKTMRFPPDMPVYEILKEIKEKTDHGGADHGLFQPGSRGTKPRWFALNRTLKFYGVGSNVRPKMSPV